MFSFMGTQCLKDKSKGIKSEVAAYKKRVRMISTAISFLIVFSLIIIVVSYRLAGDFTNPETAIYETQGSSSGNSLKAALIDALYSNYPNEDFTELVNKTFHEAGFKLDIYQGEEVTVDFLKEFASGYKVIILRMHSALTADNELYLFTSEPYLEGEHAQEQRFRLVKEAYPTEDSQSVFAVNWGFVKRLMAGKFNGSLVIAMGCDGLHDQFMAQEFINQGAIGYVAWAGPVLLSHSDRATVHLVQALYTEKRSLEKAIEETERLVGADPSFGTILDRYVP